MNCNVSVHLSSCPFRVNQLRRRHRSYGKVAGRFPAIDTGTRHSGELRSRETQARDRRSPDRHSGVHRQSRALLTLRSALTMKMNVLPMCRATLTCARFRRAFVTSREVFRRVSASHHAASCPSVCRPKPLADGPSLRAVSLLEVPFRNRERGATPSSGPYSNQLLRHLSYSCGETTSVGHFRWS